MDRIDESDLMDFYITHRQVYDQNHDYGRHRDIQTVLRDGDKLYRETREKWHDLTVEAVRIHVGRKISVTKVETERRDDVDVYYEHNNERVYLLRNHVTERPWYDAFRRMKAMLEDEISLERHSRNSGRFARIMHNANG